MYPKLLINKQKLIENTKNMIFESKKRNLELVGVTKLVAGNSDIVELMVNAGLTTIGDSRIKNLKKYEKINVKKMQLRLPMTSEISETIKYSDVCLVSEIDTVLRLNEEAKKQDKIYNIIIMIELGDIREGILGYDNLRNMISKVVECENIKIEGLGSNFACYGATIPTVEKLKLLTKYKKNIEREFNIKIEKISGGNTSHLSIWDDPEIPEDINQIRSGAGIIAGIGLNDDPIEFNHQDVLKLQCQIIERQLKPTTSWGPTGLNAFGKPITFEDRGEKIKLIIGIGKQDINYENITPIDNRITILGQSSDHTILELVSTSIEEFQVGDIIEFDLNYSAAIELFTSQYVEKEIY